jgi:hypothetical protein
MEIIILALLVINLAISAAALGGVFALFIRQD